MLITGGLFLVKSFGLPSIFTSLTSSFVVLCLYWMSFIQSLFQQLLRAISFSEVVFISKSFGNTVLFSERIVKCEGSKVLIFAIYS